MKKIILLTLLIISCEAPTGESAGTTDSIFGKWILHKSIYIHDVDDPGGDIDGGWTRIYENIDGNYLNASFIDIKFFESKLIYYQNIPHESTYEEMSIDYVLQNDSLIFGEAYWPFYINNDTLIIKIMESHDSDGNFSESQTNYYLKHNNNIIPPSSWLTILENDNFEPNNNSQEANILSINEEPEIHVITLNDEDWFKFSYTSNYTYEIVIKCDFRIELEEQSTSEFDINYIFNSDDSGEKIFKVNHQTFYFDEDFESHKYNLTGYYNISIISTPK